MRILTLWLCASLYASAQPSAPIQLSPDSDYADYPSIAATPNGDLYVAWVSYDRAGADQIRLRRRAGGRWEEPQTVTPAAGDYFKTALAADKTGRVWVTWAARASANVDLYARSLANGKWSEVTRLTDHPQPDFHHAMASDSDGNVYVCWQSFRTGDLNIYLKVFDGKRWSADIPITTHEASDWEPALAVDSSNRVHIVYDTYRHGDYDVYLRVYDHGKLSPEIPVASSENFEARATVACDREGRAWIAWDEQGPRWGLDTPFWNLASTRGDWGKPPAWTSTIKGDPASQQVGLRYSQRIGVAVYQNGNLWTPKKPLLDGLPPELADSFEIPHLQIDAQGTPWLFFRRFVGWGAGVNPALLETRPGGWTIYATHYNGAGWSAPTRLPESTGSNDQRVATALDSAGRLSIAYPADGRLNKQGIVQFQEYRRGKIFFSTLETAAGAAPQLTPAPAVPARPYRRTATADRRNVIASGEKRYQLYWGDLHRHTEISIDGGYDGTLWDMYRYSIDAAEMDFVATTDHFYGSAAKIANTKSYDWWRTQKLADLFHNREKFMPLFGYERSLSWPYGHRNVIALNRGSVAVSATVAPADQKPGPVRSPDEMRLWEALRGQDVITIPHTIATLHGTDWTYHDQALQPLMEIYQGCRMSYEATGAPRVGGPGDHVESYARTPLAKGYKMGFIASSDHRSTHISFAAVYSESPTREGIFRGLQQRHAYAATDNIVLDFRIGNAILGDVMTTDRIPELRVMVRGTAPIHEIEVIKNNQHLYSSGPGKREISFVFRDAAAQPGDAYYYIRVQQEDGQMAWASPIWVTYQPN